MNKSKEFSALLDALILCGSRLAETAEALKNALGGEIPDQADPDTVASSTPAAETVSPSEKSYSKEEIRALLAAKAGEVEGAYKAQVKALVKKYGNGGSLTDVKPEDYASLASEVKAIGNAG